MKQSKIYLIAFVLAAVVLGGVQSYLYLINSLPELSSVNRLQILEGEVKVQKDKWGIPHIFAKNNRDLYRILGYLVASERLFQMDIYRRLAKGELAEVLGEKAVKLDVRAKVLDFYGHAQHTFEKHRDQFPAEFMDQSAAFYEGINYFIDHHPLPYEFSLLGYTPEHFRLEDSLAFLGVMGLSFSSALKQDLLLHNLYKRDPKLQQMFEEVEQVTTSALHHGATATLSLTALSTLMEIDKDAPVIFTGSNSWVLAPQRSKSGFALLANDPHIHFSLPGIWYEAHLKSDSFEMYGHYIPIFPFAILGHNGTLGWALTINPINDMNLYHEDIDYDRHLVKFKDQWVPLVYKDFIISIKGGAKRILRIPYTPHGPVINQMLDPKMQEQIAVKWAFFHEDNLPYLSIFLMNQAENISQFENALQFGHSPNLNISYADRAGNIGWWMFGEIPVLPQRCLSYSIYPGSSGECEYQEIIPFAKHPKLVNPASGVIVSANDKFTELPIGVKGYWKEPDRAKTIKELLERKQLHDVASMQHIQNANMNMENLVLLQPLFDSLERSRPHSGLVQTVLTRLKEWDGMANNNSVGMSIYSVWLRYISRQLFSDLSAQEYKLFATLPLHYHLLKRALVNLDDPLWKAKNQQQIDQIIQQSFMSSISFLKKRLGPFISYWQWKNLHHITFTHPLGKIPFLGQLFNLGPYLIDGAKRHINSFATSPASFSFDVLSGVSTRRIVDFANPKVAWGILPLGESGHMLSRHYRDQWPLFSSHRYRSMLLDPIIINQETEGVMQFVPVK